MHPTAELFVLEARRHIGYAQPRLDAATPYGAWYARYLGLEEGRWAHRAWAQMFVSRCGWAVGAAEQVGVFAFAARAADWHAALGRVDRTPRAGSLAFFDWRGDARRSTAGAGIDHVAIVECPRPDLGGVFVQTIEGDTAADEDGAQRVRRRVRHVANVAVFAHPAWAPASPAPSPEGGRG